MRLLVASAVGQGTRPSDFTGCRPGELVMPHLHACDDPVDGPCGCRRSLVGVETQAATTTFEVADVALTMDGLCETVRRFLDSAGWLDCIDDADVADRWVADIAWELVQAGARFEVGAVIERRGPTLQLRSSLSSSRP